MGKTDLAEALRSAVHRAPSGHKAVTFHLFGIDHAPELNGIDLSEMAVEAGESRNWGTEIAKGVKLAQYVRRK